jgi:hypothetical protein
MKGQAHMAPGFVSNSLAVIPSQRDAHKRTTEAVNERSLVQKGEKVTFTSCFKEATHLFQRIRAMMHTLTLTHGASEGTLKTKIGGLYSSSQAMTLGNVFFQSSGETCEAEVFDIYQDQAIHLDERHQEMMPSPGTGSSNADHGEMQSRPQFAQHHAGL